MVDPVSEFLPLETYRSLVEESLTGVYLIQQDRLVYANRRLAEMFGYSREELLAIPSLFDVVAPADRELVSEKLRQRLTGEIQAIEYTVRGVRKDGQQIDLDVRSVRTMHRGQPAVMGTMVDITGRRRLEEALRNLSLMDDLTGVYNRRGFGTLAERHIMLACRKKQDMLLILADVDGLKQINDTYGHAAGDRVLIDAANLLKRTYRSADIVARLGGDEFAAFPLEAATGNADALLHRLERTIDQHNSTIDLPYALSLSVGIARFDPNVCSTIEQLLAKADEELYRRKRIRASESSE